MLHNFELIIWDYNGTIIDDVGISKEIVNIMLQRRNMQPITLERYQNTIDIPISGQYSTLGFDVNAEGFDNIAIEYNKLYSELSLNCSLREGVLTALKHIKAMNILQAVLSSSKTDVVIDGLKRFQIDEYFDAVAARDDILASGKREIGLELLKKLNKSPDKTLMIGDMFHDFEVAEELKCHCILLENGHTPREILMKTGKTILKSPVDLIF